MHVFVATDAQPLAADPDAVARDHGLAAQQRATLSSASGSVSTAMMPVSSAEIAAGPCTRASRRPPSTLLRAGAARGEERHRADLQRFEALAIASIVSTRHGFQIRAEHGFDGALPARLDDQLLAEARTLGERIRAQPLA